MLDIVFKNLNLKRIVYIIKKGIIFMILFAFIGGFLGGVYAQSKSTTTYRAHVSFYLYGKTDYIYDNSVNINTQDFTLAKSLVTSYEMVLKSATVLNKVIENLGLNMSATALANKISYANIANTAILDVYVTDADPYKAQLIANTIAEVAPEEIVRIVKSGGVSVIDFATLPTNSTTSVNMLKYILLGVVGGFGVVFVIVMLIGLMDSTIMWKSELDSSYNVPVLGEIPYISVGKKQPKQVRIINDESPFAVKESYNALCTNMLFTTNGEKCPVYVVTSAIQNEGKSLNSINIAKTLASYGKKTLLIDGDMRNPTIGAYLENDGETKGLSQYLAAIDDKLNIVSYADKFDVLYAGAVPPNPAQLLAGKQMISMLDGLKEKYDFIIIDMPPIGIVTDAMILKELIVGYIVVVRANVSKFTEETRIMRAFEANEARVSGLVFNAVDVKKSGYGYYKKYGYGYGKDTLKKNKSER